MSDIFSRSNKPLKGTTFDSSGRTASPLGVFMGYVKDNTDVQRMGRLKVWIPEFGSLPDDSDAWIIVNYCSPFAGATSPATEDKNNTKTFEGTQTSYGMWMIPPDLDVQVMVMFINGDTSKGIWIGSLYQQFMNHMVPAVAASSDNFQYGKEPTSEGHSVPTAEYNKWDETVTDPQKVRRPYSKTRYAGLSNQGLITDPIRGTSTTSARREAPSAVYGILTPGPLQKGTTTARRTGGNSFVMDDGQDSEYIQLSTKTGAQIKIDETNGFVYMINRDGTSWVQMDRDGNIDIFGAGNISMRAQRDINFRADRNINLEAGQNIYMKAAKDTTETTAPFTYDVNGTNATKTIPYWQYKGEGNGDGGNIVIQSLANIQATAHSNAFFTVKDGNLNLLINNSVAITTNTGGVDINSNKGIKVTTGAAFDLSATGKVRIGSNSDVSVSAQGMLTVCSSGQLSINSDAPVVVGSGSAIKMGASETIINSSDISIGGGIVNLNPPGMPSAGTPTTPDAAQTSAQAVSAEVKPLNDKINILPDWKSPVPDDKFVRNSEAMLTTVSRLPTFEPCPENAGFKLTNVAGYVPPTTQSDTTFSGSGSNPMTQTTPPNNTSPEAINTDVLPDSIGDNASTTDVDMTILESQIIINEGVKYESYPDSKQLPTGGIGHLLSPAEIAEYPIPSEIPKSQVDTWFRIDIQSAIRGAQRVVGNDCWVNLNDVRRRAVIDLTYNMGEGPTGLGGFVNFIRQMQSAEYTLAGASLQDSLWFREVGIRGPRVVQMVVSGNDPLDWVAAAKNIS